jgi:hypothetical protein
LRFWRAGLATVVAGAALFTGGSAMAAPAEQSASTGVSVLSPTAYRPFTGTGATESLATDAAFRKMKAYDPACVVVDIRSQHIVMGPWTVTITANCPTM